jgi:DNA polymerase-3 subunit delta'
MSWASIIGQAPIKQLLQKTLKTNRLAHAFAFIGPDGVGKDAMAIELAKVLNCDRGGIEACDECPSCLKVKNLQHPNLNLVFPLPVGKGEKYGDSPTAKLTDDEIVQLREQIKLKGENPYHPVVMPDANIIKINSVRDIRKESSLAAFGSGKQVFVLLHAEQMRDESSNAILKTLEEPSADTVLILTTSHPDVLLPTILSRCQQIHFSLLRVEDIHTALVEREHCTSEQASMIARLSNGNYTRALQLLHSNLLEKQNNSVEFLRVILRQSRGDLLAMIEQIVSEYEKPDLEEFLMMLQGWLRDAMVVHEGREYMLSSGDRESLVKFTSHYSNVRYGDAIEAIDRAISLLNKNVYIPLVLLNLALTLQEVITASGSKLKKQQSIESSERL